MGERRVQPEVSAQGPRLCRCVVLVSPRGQLPRPLLRGLEHRGAVAIVATDAPAALVDLAYSRAGALIVQDPDDHLMVDDLLAAVHRYFPKTTCWRYDTSVRGEAALSRLNGHAGNGHAPAPAQTAPPSHAQPPRVVRDVVGPRGEIEHRIDSLLIRVPQSLDPAHEPLISEEELAMLLGPMPTTSQDESGMTDEREDRA
jgi:hypothetical protein